MAKGNCKIAFENLNKAYEILKNALLKDAKENKYR